MVPWCRLDGLLNWANFASCDVKSIFCPNITGASSFINVVKNGINDEKKFFWKFSELDELLFQQNSISTFIV